jgi:hypothetical protein
MDRRLLYAALFGKSAALESHDKAIVAVNAKKVAAADVGVAESEAHRLLTVISKEPAHLSQTVYATGAEAEPLRARLASYVDVEIIKAIVAIEPSPDKSHVGSGVIDIDLVLSLTVAAVYSSVVSSVDVKSVCDSLRRPGRFLPPIVTKT